MTTPPFLPGTEYLKETNQWSFVSFGGIIVLVASIVASFCDTKQEQLNALVVSSYYFAVPQMVVTNAQGAVPYDVLCIFLLICPSLRLSIKLQQTSIVYSYASQLY
jgi:hypothetical protein